MKRKRKQFTKTTASRNALSAQEPKKRFGKKQKKKLIIIASVVLVVFIALSFVLRDFQAKRAEAAEQAKKGELIEKQADKTKVDEEGKEVVPHLDTEIHVINVGDGMSVLIKKGKYEVLVDAGSEKVVNYLEKYVDGPLEYFITTNHFNANIKGRDAVNKKFKVSHYIYNNIKSSVGEEVNGQTIDLDENTSVTVSPGVDGDDYDKTALVTVTDNENRVYIVGNASAKDITTLKANNDNSLAYITGGKPNANNTPLNVLMTINPQYVIASTGTKLSADFITNISKLNAQLYATYISKDIVLTITPNGVETTLDYKQQIRPEDNATTEQPAEEGTETSTEESSEEETTETETTEEINSEE